MTADVATSVPADVPSNGKGKPGLTRIYGPDGSTFVTCDCGCGTSGPASSFYFGLQKCPKGGPSEDFKAKFKVVEAPARIPAKSKVTKRKCPESESKASTPTKEDKENEGSQELEDKAEKKCAKKPKKASKKEEEDGAAKVKKPPSAYIIFSNDHRQAVRDENPDLKVGPIMKILADKWNNLDAEEKASYEAKAAAAKQEHVEKHGLSAAEQKKQDKADGPKKAQTAWMIFGQHVRSTIKKDHPGIPPKEVFSLISTKWKALSAKEKKVFEDMAVKEKEACASGKTAEEEPMEEEEETKEEEEAKKEEDEEEAKEKDESQSQEEKMKEAKEEESESMEEEMAEAKAEIESPKASQAAADE